MPNQLRAKIFFAFSLIAYSSFGISLGYLVAFLLDLDFLHRTVDRGPEAPTGIALLINVSLVLLFGLQHSVMARPGFKRIWTKIIPAPIERSTYVLISSSLTILLCHFWLPMPTVIWQTESTLGYWLWVSGVGLGILIQFVASFQIDHYELLGVHQTWELIRQGDKQPQEFLIQGLYRFVRHPIYVGWLLIFWFAPTMTVGHFLLALTMTAYIIVAVRYEERDLVSEFGRQYRSYQNVVPALLPRMLPIEASTSEKSL